MRSLVLALAALAFASAASAATPAGPYKLDAKGKCHAANGAYVAKALCVKTCRDPKTGKFAKCSALLDSKGQPAQDSARGTLMGSP